MPTIHFGTDGWRAIIADQFTFANVERVAQATADVWRTGSLPGTVVIGYDRRFLSDQFARTAAEVFLGNSFKVVLARAPTPTPAVSFAVKKLAAVGGVMITASHNPSWFNGYKLKASYGGPALSADCRQVEQKIDASPVRKGLTTGNASCALRDLWRSHLAAVRRFVDFQAIARSKLRIAHDAMFGVGAGAFASLLQGTSCHVTTIHGRHDPLFGGINPEPIPRNYAESASFLRRHSHDFCLVTDGDADRIGAMDGRGRPVSTHQIICLLLEHLLSHRKAGGRVVTGLTTTSMMARICAEHGIDYVETGVGFKHITQEMIRGGVLLGAEESGGIGFPGHIPERDGILAGMVLLEMLAIRRRSVRDLVAGLEKRYGPHRYARLDIEYPVEARQALAEYCQRHPPNRLLRSPVSDVKTFDGVKYVAANGSWLMLRASGTEPMVRIYAECDTDAGVQRLLKMGMELARKVRAGAGR
jgi:phosphomannomutase